MNNRYVKDKTLSAAIEQAYKGLLIVGKFPFGIINLEVNLNNIDVNVHPQKLEVRFWDENIVFKAVYHSIRETILKGDMIIPGMTNIIEELYKKKNNDVIPDAVIDNIEEKNIELIKTVSHEKVSHEKASHEKVSQKTRSKEMVSHEKVPQEMASQSTMILENVKNDYRFTIPKEAPVPEEAPALKESSVSNEASSFDNMYEKLFGKIPNKLVSKEKPKVFEATEIISEAPSPYLNNKQSGASPSRVMQKDNISVFEESEKYTSKSQYKFIGTAFATYIIIEIKNELFILDQHAAHERIMYEKIKENFYKEEERDSQLMLLPDIIKLTHKEVEIVRDNKELFKKAGFMLDDFGDNTIKISAVPNICIELDTKELFLEILDEIDTVARTAKQEIEEKLIETIACKASVKANMTLTEDEVDALMSDLLKLDNPFTCPHGRPTAIRMSKKDIEKKFSRV